MASSSVSAATHLLRSLVFRHPAGSFSLLRRHCSPNISFSKPHSRSHSLSFSSSSSLPLHAAASSPPAAAEEREDEINELAEEKHEPELEEEKGEEGEDSAKSRGSIAGFVREEREVPNLTVKEKKELGSYANSLGDKLKSQQVGKSGVTDNVVFALSETLEKNELVKLKIHKSCPGELDDVVSQVERGTGSVAVFQIGRTVIFYRPSITKMKAEEKKEQNRRLFALKRKKAQAAFMMTKREQWKRPGGGPQGSRRIEKAPS